MAQTETYNYRVLGITPAQAETLRKASEIVFRTQLDFGGKNTIVSVETGECICPDELARTRTVLEFLAQYNAVSINP